MGPLMSENPKLASVLTENFRPSYEHGLNGSNVFGQL